MAEFVSVGGVLARAKAAGAVTPGALNRFAGQFFAVVGLGHECRRAWLERRGLPSVKLEFDGDVLEVTGMS